jgi:hypothetical protein
MQRWLKCSLALGMAVYWAMSGDNAARASYITKLNEIGDTNKISYWNLEETSGVAADSWGSNDGVFSGSGITRGTVGPQADNGFPGFGLSNGAAGFSGGATDTQLLHMDSASFAGKTSLTMLMWFQMPADSSGNDRFMGGLVDTTTDETGRYGFAMNVYRDPRLRGYLRVGGPLEPQEDDASATTTSSSGDGFVDSSDGNWHFLALIMEDSGADKLLSLYVDGQIKATGTIADAAGDGLSERHTSASTGALNFGRDVGTTNRKYIGSLDEIAFIDGALTADQVLALWNAALVPEPGTMSLIGTGGLIGLIAICRRRAKKC